MYKNKKTNKTKRKLKIIMYLKETYVLKIGAKV